MKEYNALAFAWGGTFISAVTNHLSLAVSLAAGLAALIASVYSIMINRAKWRKIRAHEAYLCTQCRKAPGSIECPYPEEDRPEGCPLRK